MPWSPHTSGFREPETVEMPTPFQIPALLSDRAIAVATSAATLPLLGGLLVSHWTMNALIELGSSSEELFRGDRLPLLKDI